MATEAIVESGMDAAVQNPSEASPPSPAENNAASPAISAPAEQLAREAYERLANGRTPAEVNRELYQRPASGVQAEKPKGEPADKTATPAPAQAAKPAEAQGKAEPSQPQPAQWAEGMEAKDVQVLKRAQMDPETWAAIPPSNQKKILTNLRTAQAAADREYQQAHQGKLAAATQPATQATPTEGQDEPTPGTEAAADPGETGKAAKTAAAPPPATNPLAAVQPARADAAKVDLAQFIDPAELETLEQLGGQELAQTYRAGIGRVVEHFQQQTQAAVAENRQMAGVLEYLLEKHVATEFNSAVNELASMPGFQRLTEQTPEADTLRGKLREKALFLHRAAGDPAGYTLSEATQDAAASLFKTNVHQSAQAQLLAKRSGSMRGSPDRGDGRVNPQRPLDGKARNAAIFAKLAEGMAPDDARRAVDGS